MSRMKQRLRLNFDRSCVLELGACDVTVIGSRRSVSTILTVVANSECSRLELQCYAAADNRPLH